MMIPQKVEKYKMLALKSGVGVEKTRSFILKSMVREEKYRILALTNKVIIRCRQ